MRSINGEPIPIPPIDAIRDMPEPVTLFKLRVEKEQSRGFVHSLDQIARRCESPIELDLLDVLHFHAEYNRIYLQTIYGDLRYENRAWGINAQARFAIFPQVPIGPYRCDFVIHPIRGSRPGLSLGADALILECDGYDYHRLTTAQKNRDLERDQWIHSHYQIYTARFPGWQIHRAGDRCAAWLFGNYYGLESTPPPLSWAERRT